MTYPRYAECDLDALVAIRDELPLPPDVADVVTTVGTIRARVTPHQPVTRPTNNIRGA